MADFYQILKNAIADSGAASAAERQLLYQRARAALDNQLNNFDPPLPNEARQAQYDRLGEAIGRLEEEAGLAAKGGEARVEDVPMPPGKPPTPRLPEAKEAESAKAAPSDAAPASAAASAPVATSAAGDAAKPKGEDKAKGEPGAKGEPRAKPAKTAKPAPAPRKGLSGTPQDGRKLPLGAIAAGIVGIAVVGGGAWYALQAGLFDAGPEAPQVEATLEPKKVTVEPITAPSTPPAAPQTAARSEPEPEPAQVPAPAEVQPLTPQEPSAIPAEPAQQLPQSEPQTPATAAPTPADSAAVDASKDQERVPQVGGAGVGETAAFVIEEPSTNGTPQETRLDGNVVWEVSGDGDDATLVFRTTIPSRAATFEMTMRKNNDEALPASHVIEFVFAAAGENPDGQIKSIPGMLIRTRQNEAGTPLRGAGAQIVPGQYLIGLSNSEGDMQHNLTALSGGEWVAVPALLENNKRALFLVAKGDSGKKAVTQALAEWGQSR